VLCGERGYSVISDVPPEKLCGNLNLVPELRRLESERVRGDGIPSGRAFWRRSLRVLRASLALAKCLPARLS